MNPDCQAWFEAEDGQLVWGDLKDILPLARKDATIYLREEVDQVLFVPDFTEETAGISNSCPIRTSMTPSAMRC